MRPDAYVLSPLGSRGAQATPMSATHAACHSWLCTRGDGLASPSPFSRWPADGFSDTSLAPHRVMACGSPSAMTYEESIWSPLRDPEACLFGFSSHRPAAVHIVVGHLASLDDASAASIAGNSNP